MGGKAKLLNTEALEQIYSIANDFKESNEDIAKDIRFKLNQLTDPVYLDKMKNNFGEACVEAIHDKASALEELLELVSATADIIDSKLSSAVGFDLDKHSYQSKEDPNKLTNDRFDLRR